MDEKKMRLELQEDIESGRVTILADTGEKFLKMGDACFPHDVERHCSFVTGSGFVVNVSMVADDTPWPTYMWIGCAVRDSRVLALSGEVANQLWRVCLDERGGPVLRVIAGGAS